MDRLPPTVSNGRARPSIAGHVPAPSNPTPTIRPGWIWIGGLAGFSISIYCTSVFLGWRAAWKKSQELGFEQDADVSSRYDMIAARYDDDIDLMEKVMGLDGKRKKMCQKATGDVLEVSVGTGRNGQFYVVDQTRKSQRQGEVIKSLTFVDQSSKMLEICSTRWKEQHADFRGQVRFVVADAGVKGMIHAPGNDGFDTIIQTFGLCSMTNPVEYMKTMKDLLRKPSMKGSGGGRIFLLEHGRGHYWWINYVLDGLAKEHADRFGCWWNRDIGQIVEDSGLRVVELKRYHFGTTWALELTHADDEDGMGLQSKKTI